MDAQQMRLSRIETLWSVVRRAHDGDANQARSAQEALLDRYGGAVRRYLLGALRSDDAADEVYQEFSLKLVSGAFGSADPERGRFRSFVKTSLFRMIVDFQRRQCRHAKQTPLLGDAADFPAGPSNLEQQEEAFVQSWREELLAQGWNELAELEKASGKPYYTVLKFRVDHPTLRSPEIAERLSQSLGQRLTAGNVRVMIHRSREKLCDCLLDAVRNSLDNPTPEEVERELIELNLLGYCRSALESRAHVEAANDRRS
jgi:RNA polymerase sigma-70 factor (ECF subfamily)